MGADELKQANTSVWGSSPAGTSFGQGFEPGSREFFESVLERRSNWEQPWLPEVVPFDTFKGKQVLELGCGAGYDAFTFIRAGADYTGIDITPENPDRVRKHLAYYGLTPNVQVGDAESLSFDDETFDVVYSNGVLHSTPDTLAAFQEARRVLRPNGEFYLSVYNRDSIVYWLKLGLTDQILRGGWRERSMETRLRMVEYTTSDELPVVKVFSPRQLRRMLRDAGFVSVTTSVRKLVVEDIPLVPPCLVQRVPQGWLNAAGKRFGWYVWAHALVH